MCGWRAGSRSERVLLGETEGNRCGSQETNERGFKYSSQSHSKKSALQSAARSVGAWGCALLGPRGLLLPQSHIRRLDVDELQLRLGVGNGLLSLVHLRNNPIQVAFGPEAWGTFGCLWFTRGPYSKNTVFSITFHPPKSLVVFKKCSRRMYLVRTSCAGASGL